MNKINVTCNQLIGYMTYTLIMSGVISIENGFYIA